MRAERVYAYSDPLNDDFAGTNITTCRVGKEFRFVRSSLLWRAVSLKNIELLSRTSGKLQTSAGNSMNI